MQEGELRAEAGSADQVPVVATFGVSPNLWVTSVACAEKWGCGSTRPVRFLWGLMCDGTREAVVRGGFRCYW